MSLFNKFFRSDKEADTSRSFNIPGGIRPAEYKSMSLRSRIMPTPVPECLILPLKQHQGDSALPLVTVGQKVLKYEKIAVARGDLGVPVHAPTSGEIIAVELSPVATTNANQDFNQICIHLAPDGKDKAKIIIANSDYNSLSQAKLIEIITDAGICGMGGAGFPTARKINPSNELGIDLLIINAMECEPFITADEALVRERAAAVVIGAEILLAATSASRCVIAIEDNKTDAVEQLRTALKNSSVELKILPAKYPAGGEKQLIQAITGKEVPTGMYPADIGILLQNVGTAYAVYRAIVLGEPCISRITTLTGSTLQTPKNFETLLGVPASFLFELCGIDEKARVKTIVGGSMMGVETLSNDIPITKTTNCVIAGSAQEFPTPAPEHSCIRCGFCANVCPAKLLPQQLLTYSISQDQEQLEEHGIFDCIECGACAYICPSNIPLVQYYRSSKSLLKGYQTDQEQSAHWQERFQFHQYRGKKAADDAMDKKPKANKTKERIEQETVTAFDDSARESARQEIAAAVARVQARKPRIIASSNNVDQDKPEGNSND
ncbi:MAG: electron transport complex subunit RsxC [SAR86 cluster bacterium]|uniref:Ion-translocating oxidoreductase complex subunit C n=1 Tax=SAR86 cluster bacterium TaxID=2030880 RepID=A0A2A5AV05_9GAMM|nr:MAG: electron transport complex subunit RsxC [SAR86 cluster bacterium]